MTYAPWARRAPGEGLPPRRITPRATTIRRHRRGGHSASTQRDRPTGADNVATRPGGVAQLVERLTGSQEVRGFESHRLHSKSLLRGSFPLIEEGPSRHLAIRTRETGRRDTDTSQDVILAGARPAPRCRSVAHLGRKESTGRRRHAPHTVGRTKRDAQRANRTCTDALHDRDRQVRCALSCPRLLRPTRSGAARTGWARSGDFLTIPTRLEAGREQAALAIQ